MQRAATEQRAGHPAPAGGRLDGLQVLRFFAAFSVLFGHSLHEALSFGLAPAESAIGVAEGWNFGSGVDVFFALSGFLMFYISAESFGAPGAQPQRGDDTGDGGDDDEDRDGVDEQAGRTGQGRVVGGGQDERRAEPERADDRGDDAGERPRPDPSP